MKQDHKIEDSVLPKNMVVFHNCELLLLEECFAILLADLYDDADEEDFDFTQSKNDAYTKAFMAYKNCIVKHVETKNPNAKYRELREIILENKSLSTEEVITKLNYQADLYNSYIAENIDFIEFEENPQSFGEIVTFSKTVNFAFDAAKSILEEKNND